MAKPSGGHMTVAYITSRFPKISETFVLDELNAVRAAGVDIEFFPLQREPATVTHPTVDEWCERATFVPFVSAGVVAANVRSLRRDPRRYLRTLAAMVRGTARSRRFLFGAVAFWPKIVAIAEQIRAGEVSHVHCHFASHPALVGLAVRRLTGVPFSFTAHGSDLHRDQTMLGDKVAAASFVITISAYNRSVIEACAAPADTAKIHLIRCGLDLSTFGVVDRSGRTGLSVVCVGTLHEVKGQAHLISALARLGDPSVTLTLVGDGPDESMLRSLVTELGLDGQVRFAGRRTRPQVLEHLREADVLVAPSVPTSDGRREGIPVVLIEAMATELPVISSRLSGIPELVDHDRTGLLTEPGDVDAIADALRLVADDAELRNRLGNRARSEVEADFDMAKTSRRIVSLFEASAASSGMIDLSAPPRPGVASETGLRGEGSSHDEPVAGKRTFDEPR